MTSGQKTRADYIYNADEFLNSISIVKYGIIIIIIKNEYKNEFNFHENMHATDYLQSECLGRPRLVHLRSRCKQKIRVIKYIHVCKHLFIYLLSVAQPMTEYKTIRLLLQSQILLFKSAILIGSTG